MRALPLLARLLAFAIRQAPPTVGPAPRAATTPSSKQPPPIQISNATPLLNGAWRCDAKGRGEKHRWLGRISDGISHGDGSLIPSCRLLPGLPPVSDCGRVCSKNAFCRHTDRRNFPLPKKNRNRASTNNLCHRWLANGRLIPALIQLGALSRRLGTQLASPADLLARGAEEGAAALAAPARLTPAGCRGLDSWAVARTATGGPSGHDLSSAHRRMEFLRGLFPILF